jgi:two-component system chemotaxis response regulator CheB
VVTLDIEMPGMNGWISGQDHDLRPMPVIIVSGLTQAGSDATARALALGAVDCYCKADPGGGIRMAASWPRWCAMPQVRVQRRVPPRPPIAAPHAGQRRGPCQADRHWFLDRRGGGVAGPARQLSQDCPPTMIVQHVDSRFAPAIARTLNAACPAQVTWPNRICRCGAAMSLAPGDDRHMMVTGTRTMFVKLRPAIRCRAIALPSMRCSTRWRRTSGPMRWASC